MANRFDTVRPQLKGCGRGNGAAEPLLPFYKSFRGEVKESWLLRWWHMEIRMPKTTRNSGKPWSPTDIK